MTPDYPRFGGVTDPPPRLLWLTRGQNQKKGQSQLRTTVSRSRKILIVAISVLSACLIGQVTDWASNQVLWLMIGLVVGWGMMLEHGLVAIYFGAWWGTLFAGIVATTFAEHSLNLLSAACIGLSVGVMITRRVHAHESSAAELPGELERRLTAN